VPAPAPIHARAVTLDTAVAIAPERPAPRRRPAIKKEDLAARSEELPELEGFVGSERRSEGVSIISPLIGQTVQGEVSFRWERTTTAVYVDRVEQQGGGQKESYSAESHTRSRKAGGGIILLEVGSGGRAALCREVPD